MAKFATNPRNSTEINPNRGGYCALFLDIFIVFSGDFREGIKNENGKFTG